MHYEFNTYITGYKSLIHTSLIMSANRKILGVRWLQTWEGLAYNYLKWIKNFCLVCT
jgi:hypothetical protein